MTSKLVIEKCLNFAEKWVKEIPTVLGEEAAMLSQDIQDKEPKDAYDNFIIPFIKKYLLTDDRIATIQSTEVDFDELLHIVISAIAKHLIALLAESYT